MTATEYQRQRRARLRSQFALTGEVPTHNREGYLIGRRCRICRQANSDYHRPYMQGVRDQQRRERDPNGDFDWEGDG